MIPRRIYEHVKAHNWFAVAVDLVIVVLGVFIGVQVDNWWTGLADARRERAYLAALKEDFSQVIAELDDDAGSYETIADSMILLLEQSRLEEPTMSRAELSKAFSAMTVMVGTGVVADTYENLTGSGDLRLIKSQELKNRLAAFYAQERIIQLVGATHEMQLVNLFQPYIIANLDYLSAFDWERKERLPRRYIEALPPLLDDPRILEALKTPEFRNTVAIKFDIATDSLDVINEAREDAKQVAALLDAELAKRR